MSGSLPAVVIAYLAVVAVVAAAAAVGLRCASAAVTGAVVAQLLLMSLAAVDVVTLVRGHRPAEMATHLGYVAMSVALLPLLAGPGRERRGTQDRPAATRPRQGVLAVACGAAIVVVIRQRETWQP